MQIDLTTFLKGSGVLVDVRSPSEYLQGTIPGAVNLPLFSDAERAEIGTLYKKCGHQIAVDRGLEIVGPRLLSLVEQARLFCGGAPARLFCWRGGMRSGSLSWLLNTAGLSSAVLIGGYKAFRKWVLEVLQQSYSLKAIGGLTGTGKTSVIQALAAIGEQVLDLENLAHHRGSSYGMIGMPSSQPSNEQFENLIAVQLAAFDPTRAIWVEDESRLIGSCLIPNHLYSAIKKAPLNVISSSREARIRRLESEYGNAPQEQLIECTRRIEKKLGGLRTKQAMQAIKENRLIDAIHLVLDYYDMTYEHGLNKREAMIQFPQADLSPKEWAQLLYPHK